MEGATLSVEAMVRSKPGRVPEDEANELIRHAQATCVRVREARAAFDTLATRAAITFAVIEDYGMGALTVCRLVGDQLVWK
jgi:hypothetical protein